MNAAAWVFLAAAAIGWVLFAVVFYDNARLSERLRGARRPLIGTQIVAPINHPASERPSTTNQQGAHPHGNR